MGGFEIWMPCFHVENILTVVNHLEHDIQIVCFTRVLYSYVIWCSRCKGVGRKSCALTNAFQERK